MSQQELATRFPALARPELRSRGAAEESLRRGLFRTPFGRAFYEGYALSAGFVPVSFEGMRTSSLSAAFVDAPKLAPEPPLAAPPLAAPATPRGSATVTVGAASAPPARPERQGLMPRWEFGAALAQAPVRAGGFSVGLTVAVSWGSGLWRAGARASYGFARGAWLATGDLHRWSLQGLAGVEGGAALAPYAQLGAGWGLIGATGGLGPRGDPAVPTARVGAGARWTLPGAKLALRAGPGLNADWVRVDGARRWCWSVDLGAALELLP